MVIAPVSKWIQILLLVVGFSLLVASSARAEADLAVGAKVFKANCIGCHLGGRNTVVADKTLALEALQKYHMNSQEAIMAQVTKGKGAMPAFDGRLKPSEIDSVAAYVLEQAQNQWGKGLA